MENMSNSMVPNLYSNGFEEKKKRFRTTIQLKEKNGVSYIFLEKLKNDRLGFKKNILLNKSDEWLFLW